MRAISMLPTSRTVMDATTSSRASFSLTLLRRISPGVILGLPIAAFRWLDRHAAPPARGREQKLRLSALLALSRGEACLAPTGAWQRRARAPSIAIVLDLEQGKGAQD